MRRIEIITGVERRRRYSDAERAAILERCDEPGATIVGVAKAIGMSPSLIHNWKRLRREAEKIASEPMQFIPTTRCRNSLRARFPRQYQRRSPPHRRCHQVRRWPKNWSVRIPARGLAGSIST